MLQRVIRIAELASVPGKPGRLPVSPATIWRWVRESETTGFPKPFSIGPRTTVWSTDAIDAFIAKQSEGRRDV